MVVITTRIIIVTVSYDYYSSPHITSPSPECRRTSPVRRIIRCINSTYSMELWAVCVAPNNSVIERIARTLLLMVSLSLHEFFPAREAFDVEIFGTSDIFFLVDGFNRMKEMFVSAKICWNNILI